MKLKFSLHFQERIIERSLNVDHVKAAIRNPDTSEATFEGRRRVTKSIDDKKIEVVYFNEGFRDRKEEYIIITAYYL